MKFEFSAGGIVLRQAQDFGSKPQYTKKVDILLCQHSQHHGWVFPKGLIGDKANTNENKKTATTETQKKTETQKLSASDKFSDSAVAASDAAITRETKEEAALREVEEETGVYAKIIKPLTPVTYWYKFDNEKRKKTVYYFLMEYMSGDTKEHDFEMENVEWLPIEEVEKRLTYKSDKEVWIEAEEKIRNSNIEVRNKSK